MSDYVISFFFQIFHQNPSIVECERKVKENGKLSSKTSRSERIIRRNWPGIGFTRVFQMTNPILKLHDTRITCVRVVTIHVNLKRDITGDQQQCKDGEQIWKIHISTRFDDFEINDVIKVFI